MAWLDPVREIVSAGLVAAGVVFFMAGSVGLLRFPDLFTRLHAVTKADNVGLGLIAAGLVVEAATPRSALEIVGIWLLVLAASSVVGHLIARRAQGSAPMAGEGPGP